MKVPSRKAPRTPKTRQSLKEVRAEAHALGYTRGLRDGKEDVMDKLKDILGISTLETDVSNLEDNVQDLVNAI